MSLYFTPPHADVKKLKNGVLNFLIIGEKAVDNIHLRVYNKITR